MNTVTIRTFSEAGLIEFERVITELKSGNLKDIPENLLYSEEYVSIHEPVVNIEPVDYKNKIDLIPYLANKLNLDASKQLYFDKGLWSWLAAFYFDNICPVDGNGRRKINEMAFYVLRDPRNFRKFYRHLLAYPSRTYAELRDSAKIFLVGTFMKRGELTEQLGAYQQIALNKGIIEAANILYWSEEGQNLKRGAAGKGGGSARRLVKIIGQYQLTYDLNSMKGSEIVDLLPHEFAKWRAN